MEVCQHQVQYNGLCAVCGTLLESSDNPPGVLGGGITMGYDTKGITVSREEAERLDAENARRLLKDKKLSLILDLDQTLVHATWDQRVLNYIHKGELGIAQFQLPGSDIIYFMKTRPGLHEFLREVGKYYELHVYTMGTRKYAEAIMSEIDPDGSIFKERILSRDESGSVTQKKLQRLFPCDTSMVVVLDDRSDVWSFSPNLLRIKPYEFFIGAGDINSRQNLQQENQHEMTQEVAATSTTANLSPFHTDDKDNELSTILKILKEIHTAFYSAKDPQHDIKEADVTQIIPKMKKRVLSGVIITFSDTILPDQTTKDPTLSWIWQMATSFGATCSIDLTGKTTHLVAIETSKHKVKAAREYGSPTLHVVTPAWLLDSTAKWAIQPEENYPVNIVKGNSPSTDEEEEQDEGGAYSNSTANIIHSARAGTVADTDSVFYAPRSADTPSENDARNGNNHLTENVNWDEADREVEEFINESGIDDVWEDTGTEESVSGNSSTATTPKSTTSATTTTTTTTATTTTTTTAAAPRLDGVGVKRKRREQSRADDDSSATEEDEEEENETSKQDLTKLSRLAKRKLRAKQRGKSKLSKVMTPPSAATTTTTTTSSTTATSTPNVSGHTTDNEISSGGNSSDSDTDDSSTSSLSDLADILDEALDQ